MARRTDSGTCHPDNIDSPTCYQVPSRRRRAFRFHAIFVIALVGTTILSTPTLAQTAPASRYLQQPVGIELLETRTKIEMDLEGELRVADNTGKQKAGMRTIPLKAKASQDYFEATAFVDSKQTAGARQYLTARLENWVSGKSTLQTLRTECSQTLILPYDGTWEQHCQEQPLDRREVELLRSPINTMMLERVLPNKPAKTDSDWVISDDDARCLFNLDAVHQSHLRAKVASVEKGIAKIEIQGDLQGTADSVSTSIQLRGSVHAKIGSQGAMVTWMGLSIQEEREISQYRPAFNVTARIQLLRQEEPGKLKADRSSLLQKAAEDDPARWLVRLESTQGKFQMYAGRNWVVFVEGTEDSVLKLIEKNRAIAQCNIGQLPKLDAGSQMTAEGLQADIQAALQDRFGELLETTEKVTPAGLRLVRMEVAGTQEQIPIRWIYAHLSDDSGRRLALVFTLAAEYAEQFAGSDLQILDSLQFVDSMEEGQQSAQKPSETVR